ncbi:sensor domain-containing diguanylate cyclase [Paenibacillus sp. YPG26]|uniref:sensor domain-containing diguanylate cyclase n=1 Tax=Paenibacillus sp. YPG26 TaxID=2878915 RepID=UPI0020407723|nr:sensor domain-containing diguanylate cyclase [Paenibacillus sp. YPG26]USB31915.1 sensor domain-containing diguanylate cyclase [Paenibacillus sp. YPG26]
MKLLHKKGYTLRFSISFLVIVAVLLTMLIGMISAVQVSRDSLISSYLQSNSQYAKKLASNTGDLLSTMKQNITSIAAIVKSGTRMDAELLGHLYQENRQYFNSIFIANEERVIQFTSPNTTGVHAGDQLTSQASLLATTSKAPFISNPYRSKSGRYIILISAPIFDRGGEYKGFVGGTIYLEEKNVLNTLLEEHFFGNGSYVFVVEKTGHLIFHPDTKRIGQSVLRNTVVQQVLQGSNGAQHVTNSQKHDFFAGYAYDPISSWGIIAQTPVSVIDGPSSQLIHKMLLQSLPFLALILILGWWLASQIAKPLHILAKFSDEATLNLDKGKSLPDLKSNHYEVRLLYQSVKIAFKNINQDILQLRDEVKMDGLTGLGNRKSFDSVMEKLTAKHTPFSLILMDIDNFKTVNDTYGHLTGDEVLKFLAGLMEKLAGDNSLAFRYGGEEFAILVKHSDISYAYQIAERIRTVLAVTNSPTGEPVTISLGIASYPDHAREIQELILKADQAMYQSKLNGRNRTTISEAH